MIGKLSMTKLPAIVNYVQDGDTINISVNGTPTSSRARWIDAPEVKHAQQESNDAQILLHWKYGESATNFVKQQLANYIKTKAPITVFSYGKDQYGRLICDWYLGNVSLSNNLQYLLLSSGLAMPFFPINQYDFSPREVTLYKGMIAGLANSYRSGLGFWPDYKSGKFLPPSEIKKLTI